MNLAITLLLISIAAFGQTTVRSAGAGLSDSTNLPVQKIGADDLLGISVYDAPELTRTLRVASDGTLRLPMVKRRIKVGGLLPVDVENLITDALRAEELLVDPVVTVSVVESRSRPVTVIGAVKRPTSFQATGTMTLLDAIARAEGLADDAGADILISRTGSGIDGEPAMLTRRILAKALLEGGDSSLNIILQGGEEIRVPAAGRVFVLGNVKKPGAFVVRDANDTTVMKALALSEGLMPFAGQVAYIYRNEGGAGAKSEIPIELKKIMARKSPDVQLMANDILYVPDRNGQRIAITALEKALMIGTGFGTAAMYVTR